jgi:hypothetical protein
MLALSQTGLFRSASFEPFALFHVVASQHSKPNQFEDKGYTLNKKRNYQNTLKHCIISFIVQNQGFLKLAITAGDL